MKRFLEAVRKRIKYILHRPLHDFYKFYTRAPRIFKYEGLAIRLLPGIFHPRFFGSTLILLRWLKGKDLKGKKIVELGTGSGLISLYLAREGAEVTATDLSQTAVNLLQANALRNDLSLEIIQSDLFEELGDRRFDYVIINPPYFPLDPGTEAEHAFYCGSDFEYFRRLFNQIRSRGAQELVWMILSQDCDLEKIHKIARETALSMLPVYKERHFYEWFYIFQVDHLQSPSWSF